MEDDFDFATAAKTDPLKDAKNFGQNVARRGLEANLNSALWQGCDISIARQRPLGHSFAVLRGGSEGRPLDFCEIAHPPLRVSSMSLRD